ncbi:MAG: hypothetical protein ACRDRO_06335, partial [Pseudonocardiaceae bacterium]
MNGAINWMLLVIGIAIGGGAGYVYARFEVWLTKKKMGWRLLKGGLGPLLKTSAVALGLVTLLIMVGLSYLGMLKG